MSVLVQGHKMTFSCLVQVLNVFVSFRNMSQQSFQTKQKVRLSSEKYLSRNRIYQHVKATPVYMRGNLLIIRHVAFLDISEVE